MDKCEINLIAIISTEARFGWFLSVCIPVGRKFQSQFHSARAIQATAKDVPTSSKYAQAEQVAETVLRCHKYSPF